MLELLLVVAFTLHLVAVNVAAAGPLFCVALEWRATRRGDNAAQDVGRRLAVISTLALAGGIAIGALMLAILWNKSPAYLSALQRVSAHRWWFAGGEIVFYLVCMVSYVVLWNQARDQRWWHRLLAIMAATNLLYHFPPLFTMISLLSTRGELAQANLDRSLYLELFTDAEVVARVVHHWLASLTTAGMAVMLLAMPRRSSAETAASRTAYFIGARSALAATLLQLPIGLWVLLGLPPSAQTRLLGGESLGTALFGCAIFAIVLLVMQLMAASLGDTRRRTAIACAILLFVVLLLMSGVLHQARDVPLLP